MGLQSIVTGDLRPALIQAAVPAQVATQISQCEYTYRSLTFLAPPGARTSQQSRQLEVIISDLIVRLVELKEGAGTSAQADAVTDLHNLLYSRLAMVSVYRQLITPDVEPTDNALLLDLIDVAGAKKALLVDQVEAELNCLRYLIEAHNELRDIQWMTAIVALADAKTELARARKLPFYKSYVSLHWMASYLSSLQARASLYFHKIFLSMQGASSASPLSTSPLPNLIRRPEWPLMSHIESQVAKCGALCACLIYNGYETDSRPAMMQGYKFPADVERPSGLRSWSCIYSYSATSGFSIDSQMANIVCLLMENGDRRFGRAVLHREPNTKLCYLYMQVELLVYFVAIWPMPQSPRVQTQFIQTWTTLGQSIRHLPHPSQLQMTPLTLLSSV